MKIEIKMWEYKSATAKMTIWDKESATIADLFARERQQGHATKLMEAICTYADENNIDILLTAKRYGHPIGPTTLRLVKFYEKFGFEVLGRDRSAAIMERKSQKLHRV